MGIKSKTPIQNLPDAPFFASINWNFSDLIHKHEPKWITRKIGFLLFAHAQNS